jgi:hypothetical protein
MQTWQNQDNGTYSLVKCYLYERVPEAADTILPQILPYIRPAQSQEAVMATSHRPLIYRAAASIVALSLLALSGCVAYPYGYGGYGYGYPYGYAYGGPAVVVGGGGWHGGRGYGWR